MDIDSPTSHRSEDIEEDNDDDVSGYDAQLLELEPLREDSDGEEELIDNDASKQEDNDDNDDVDDNDEQAGSSSSASSEEEEDDTHVQGLTSNEREILTLLAVDKVNLTF